MADSKLQSNFYEYVNEKWLSDPKNDIPSDYSSWGGFVELHDTGLKNQIKIVKDLFDESSNKLDESIISKEEVNKIKTIWGASEKRFDDWEAEKTSYVRLEAALLVLSVYLREYIENGNVKSLGDYIWFSHQNGYTNVINFDKGTDLGNNNNVLLDVATSGLSLPSRDFYFDEKFKDKFKMFRDHLNNVEAILENSDIPCIKDKRFGCLPDNFVDNVISFELKLAYVSMTPSQRRNYDKYYQKTNLSDLYASINSLNYLKEKDENYNNEDFNFEENIDGEVVRSFRLSDDELLKTKELMEHLYTSFEFRDLMNKNRDRDFDENDSTKPKDEEIVSYDGDGLKRVLNILFSEDENVRREYYSYSYYQIIKSFASIASKELNEEFFDFYGRKLHGQQEQKPREKRSIALVNQLGGELLGKLFVANYFSESSKNSMKNMILDQLVVMEDSLENCDWLTPETKKIALDKLQKFNYKIGYPNVWKDYSKLTFPENATLYDVYRSVNIFNFITEFQNKLSSKKDKTEWGMTPQTVNAYFSPSLNEIVFPAAILQPPFFHTELSSLDFNYEDEMLVLRESDILYASNMGGIGSVIAHEITHGYDDQGRKYNGDGALVDWWKKEDAELFNEKCEFVKKMTQSYSFVDEGKEHKINAELTMGENLADINGLSISLKVLNKYLNNLNYESLKVNKDTYMINAHRVFFKSWATSWRLKIKKERKIMLLSADPHAPADFRANLVKNFQEFHKAFDIQEGSAMYVPENERVNMW